AQVKALFASALIRASGPLSSALDLNLSVDVRHANGERLGSVAVSLTSEQRRAKQALATVALAKPRAVGSFEVSWHVGTRCLHRQAVEVVSKKTLSQSLRIS